MQRFITKNRVFHFSYLDLSGQFIDKGKSKCNYLSKRLKDFVFYYINRLSYSQLSILLEEITGNKLLSGQNINNLVIQRGYEISKNIRIETEKIIKDHSDLPLPLINTEFDIYDKETKEILYLEDGIQVKKQKEKRDCQNKIKRERINTDIALLEKNNGDYEYITDCLFNDKKSCSFVDIVKSKLIKYYNDNSLPPNILAITDGAKNIRNHLSSIFECNVNVILDWYHLNKKLYELLSMISFNKSEKNEHLAFLLGKLWKGNVDSCLDYLSGINSRNQSKLDELLKYLTKHKSEIINYELRNKIGKPIGSGRMEKGVDLVIGNRQKRKGMSWSKKGSRSLGLLKVKELNMAA